MTVCALVGIVSMVALITVQWGDTGRYVVGVIVASVAGFLAFATGAVLTAARDTYARSNHSGLDE